MNIIPENAVVIFNGVVPWN